jgi:hypothetical protein
MGYSHGNGFCNGTPTHKHTPQKPQRDANVCHSIANGIQTTIFLREITAAAILIHLNLTLPTSYRNIFGGGHTVAALPRAAQGDGG